MKYLVFLLILCFYTEGSLRAQVPTVLDSELTVDSTAVEENAIEEEESSLPRRPRVSPYAAAQEKYNQEAINQRDIDAEKWRKATAGIDYSDDKMKKPEPEKPTNSRSSGSSGAGVAILAGALLMFLKWFFIIGGIALIAFLIYRFIGEGNVFGTKSRKIAVSSDEIDLEHIEENLEKAELDPIISKAIATKNFPLAIRLYYLAILKELTLAGAIKWKKDKTNRIYVQEMQPHPLMENFRQVTTIFERVWYGDTPLDEAGFEQIQPSFQGLLRDTRHEIKK
jgi:Domain of unknown function (DUF4129)